MYDTPSPMQNIYRRLIEIQNMRAVEAPTHMMASAYLKNAHRLRDEMQRKFGSERHRTEK